MKNFKLILLYTVSLSLFACEKVTEQVPESLITGSNFFKTASDADNAIIGCYDAMQINAINYVIWGDARTDVFASTDRSSSGELQLSNGNVGSSNGFASWNFLYSAMNRINNVLKYVPPMTDPALAARKERILGEAYFLRAMVYFYLTRTFENAPLVLEPFEGGTANLYPALSDRAALFAQIETDLKAALDRVPDVPFGSTLENKGRATKGAIRSALADLYLWQKKYEDAAEMARLVITSPANYSLVPGANYASIFVSKNTSESIFEIQYNYTYQEGNNNTLTDLFLPIGATYNAGNWRFQPSDAVFDALPVNDLRRNATFRNSGPVPAPYRDPNQWHIVKYPGTVANNVLQWDSNRIVYRLSEIILFRAEALNESGKTADAIPLLNQIRNRAGVGNTTAVTQAEVKLAIEKERLSELVYEGKRYYDLVRTGRYAAVTGHSNVNWVRWPIPASELVINPNLVPNPGY